MHLVDFARQFGRIAIPVGALWAQAVCAGPVEGDAESFRELVSPNATLQVLLRKPDGFFEGPTWVPQGGGFLVVSAIPDNQLVKIDCKGRVSILASKVVKKPSASAIHDTLYTNRVLSGSNGTAYAGWSALYLAEFGGTAITRYDIRRHKRRAIGSGSGVPAFHLPNDILVGPRGDIYFSAHEGIFRIHNGRTRLFRSMAANGLAFSPDGTALYASDGLTTILRIAVNPDGSAGEAKVFLETGGDPAKDEFLDGMKVDRAGNLWAVAPGGIWVITPDGKRLGRIQAPAVDMPTGRHARFTNIAFGGSRGSVLYLTAPGAIYSLQLKRSAVRLPHMERTVERCRSTR